MSSMRTELIEMQAKLARMIASLPEDDEKPAKKKPRRRGVRIVDPSTLPGPKPSELAMAAARRLGRSGQ